MSWQSFFPDVSLDVGGAFGAWDADMFNDVAMLLDGHTDGAGSDGESGGGGGATDDGRSSDLMDEDDLAILTELLHSAQQSEAAARLSTSTDASSTEAAPPPASTVPTALVVVPPEPSSKAPATRKSDKTAGATELQDETIPLTGKTTRERRKEEVAYLRVRAQELEAKLAKLKQQLQLQMTGDGEQCSDLVTRPHAAAPLSRYAALWMKLAKRQDEERRLALAENAKLRQLVVAQVRLARSLDRVLRKRMKHKLADGDASGAER
ncbi:hypothetical protein PybrP1_011909 [[Pythium] brassicae (nom. inval.)]|nr:hypothetical protein PybrP1_011909 [[Pythium] brassicae (nom. inval.)]